MQVALETWGQEFRHRRTNLGMSRLQLADRIGTTEMTIWRWETDRVRPNYCAGIDALLAELEAEMKTATDPA